MTLTNEQQVAAAKVAYDQAIEAQAAAKKILDELKAGSAATIMAYEAAKAAFNNLKPAMDRAKAGVQRADANVTTARLDLKALDPKAVPSSKGAGNKELLAHVVTILTGKPDGMTNGDIFDALSAAGVQMAGEKPRENFNAYLARWGAVNAGGLVSKGTGKWGVGAAAPAAAPVPDFLGGGAVPPAAPPVPDFIAPAPPLPDAAPTAPTSTPLDATFPGFEPLTAAGYKFAEDLAGKTKDELTTIAGIGKATADKILAALA